MLQDVTHFFLGTLDDLIAMRHLATGETDAEVDRMALFHELVALAQDTFTVGIATVARETQFLELGSLGCRTVLLFHFALLFLLFVFVLAAVAKSGHLRILVGSHDNDVETALIGNLACFLAGNDTELLAILAHQAHGRRGDAVLRRVAETVHRRVRCRVDTDQGQVAVIRDCLGLAGAHDPHRLAALANQHDGRSGDVEVVLESHIISSPRRV